MIGAEEFLSHHRPWIKNGDDDDYAADTSAGGMIAESDDDDTRERPQSSTVSSTQARPSTRAHSSACFGSVDKVVSDSVDERKSMGKRAGATTRRSQSKTWRRGAVADVHGTAVDSEDAEACREAALRLLDAAPRSSGALREKLIDKGYAATVVDDVIDRLTRVQLLDDRAYAESTVRVCVNRLMGRRGTVTELVRKGVDRSLAESVAAQAESQGVFEDAAWELGRRYASKGSDLDPAVCRRRFWSAGGRKGHSPDVLRRVADELMP